MTGLILAAGLGTRLKPWTDHHPKALVKVGGKPMLQHVIENIARADINDIIINVHHMSNQITDFISANNNFGLNIIISDETRQLLDTGGAIVKVAHLLNNNNGPLLIHNADIFTNLNLKELIDHHNDADNDATLLTSVRTSSRQLLFNKTLRLYGWVNNATGDTLPENISINPDETIQLSFNGIHIINRNVINWLIKHAPTDVFPIIPQYIKMSKKLKIGSYTPSHEYIWTDIGKPDTLEKAELSLKIARSL